MIYEISIFWWCCCCRGGVGENSGCSRGGGGGQLFQGVDGCYVIFSSGQRRFGGDDYVVD